MRNPFSQYKITSDFGPRTHPVTHEIGKMHNGVDIAIPGGTPLPAMSAGVVDSIGYDDISGNYVRVKMPNGDIYSYAHMQEPSALKKGQQVSTGTIVGKVGRTGRATGYHLHLSYKRKTKSGYQNIDPLSVFEG